MKGSLALSLTWQSVVVLVAILGLLAWVLYLSPASAKEVGAALAVALGALFAPSPVKRVDAPTEKENAP